MRKQFCLPKSGKDRCVSTYEIFRFSRLFQDAINIFRRYQGDEEEGCKTIQSYNFPSRSQKCNKHIFDNIVARES